MARPATGGELVLLECVRGGWFEIDAEGCVWRLAVRRDGKWAPCARRRAEKLTGHGYLTVRVMLDGHRHCALAHRLVYVAKRGPIPPGHEVNHINGRKDDNRPENLEAITASENMIHAHRTGLLDQRGEANPAATLTDADVVAIRVLYLAGEHTMQELGDLFGVGFGTVAKLVKGQRRRTAGGPIASEDLRHDSCEHDATTGRFVGPRTSPSARSAA